LTTDTDMIIETMDIVRTLKSKSIKISEKLMYTVITKILNYILGRRKRWMNV